MTTYDVIYTKDGGVRIEPHFCREYDCFGTNPDHGMSLERAAEVCAEFHDEMARRYRAGTHSDILNYTGYEYD